jgi:cytochrome c oxidase assembly protein subunit 15
MRTKAPLALHRYAVFLVGATVLLIAAGGLVKSLEAGLSVPDWPTSYGGLNPPGWWSIQNVRAEHGHRLVAGTVALLTVALAIWAARREPRAWVRRLGYCAVVAVLLQALLGGLTVLFFLPTAISVSHAALAQLFLCLVVAFAVVTAPSWEAPASVRALRAAADLRPLATATTLLVYGQILVGALVRHTGAGLAIPDFPRMFGRWWPPTLDFPVAVHLTHRLGAVLVTAAVLAILVRVRRHPGSRTLLAPAVTMAALVLVQVSLGATIIWTGRAVLPNTLHVPVGACLLLASWVLTLRTWRWGLPPRASTAAIEDSAAATA